MWEWLDRAVPHSLVELAVSSAQLCTLSSDLLRSGWQGLLLEGNPAFYAHLHDSWKNSPGVVCRMDDFYGDLEIARVLAEASITSEFGVLILNELNLASGNLEQVWQAGFRPWIVVFQECAEATI